ADCAGAGPARAERPGHREGSGPVRGEPIAPLLPWLLRLLPGKQSGERRRPKETAMALEAHERSQPRWVGVSLRLLVGAAEPVHLRSHVRDLPHRALADAATH